MSQTGLRSNETPRKRFGIPVPIRRLCEVDLLHLDDLGAEKRTEWVLEQLYSIVNERWQNERSIVVTTNLGLDELRDQIGLRTVSRIEGVCGPAIPIMGRDLRQVAAP